MVLVSGRVMLPCRQERRKPAGMRAGDLPATSGNAVSAPPDGSEQAANGLAGCSAALPISIPRNRPPPTLSGSAWSPRRLKLRAPQEALLAPHGTWPSEVSDDVRVTVPRVRISGAGRVIAGVKARLPREPARTFTISRRYVRSE